MENLKHIIESLLFVAEEPLTVDKIKHVTVDVEIKDIKEALSELAADYETRWGGFYLDEVAGGYQIRSRPEYNEWIRKLIQPKPLRLSKAALETLVIIAYKQPIIRSDVEHLRGVDCGGVLRVLLERKLIRVLGRREIAGRPLIYATTKHFLEVFDLKNLKDLPTPKEIEELGASLSESEGSTALEFAAQTESEIDSAAVSDGFRESSEIHTASPIATDQQVIELEDVLHKKKAEEPSESHASVEIVSDNLLPAEKIPDADMRAEEQQNTQFSPAPPAESEMTGDSFLPIDAEQSSDEPKDEPQE